MFGHFQKNTCHSICNDRFGVHLVVIHAFFCHVSMGHPCRVLAARRRRCSTKRATLGWLGVDDCRLFGSGWWLLMIGSKWKARNKNVVCFAWGLIWNPKNRVKRITKKLKNISSRCWFCENHEHKMFISCNSFGVTVTPGLLAKTVPANWHPGCRQEVTHPY